jgi:hypothetical protein
MAALPIPWHANIAYGAAQLDSEFSPFLLQPDKAKAAGAAGYALTADGLLRIPSLNMRKDARRREDRHVPMGGRV